MRRFVPVFIGLAAAFLGGAAQAQSRYDGTWSVEVVTEKGDCDKAYRYPVIVQGGRVRYGGPEAFDATGRVSANGAVNLTIRRGSDGAHGQGRLDGKWGQGRWTTSGSRTCSGRWLAEKRG